MQIEVLVGDIATVTTEVVVTAANTGLAGGGGVDGAIHRAAGPELLQALRPLAPCPVGQAVITPAFRIPGPVAHVVHAVGPRYGFDEPSDALLASAYTESLRLCDEVGAASVAFPCISTGAFGYPVGKACEISIRALRRATTKVERCLLVAFDERTAGLWRAALSSEPS